MNNGRPIAAYVQAIDGSPLMPTRKKGKVRHLLKDGLATVVCRVPFTIRLTYETTRYVQKVSLGIDTGYGSVGLSATTGDGDGSGGGGGEVLYEEELTLRDDVKGNISTRAELRRGRRSRNTRYREARFDNRRTPEGWIPPSMSEKVDSHVSMVERAAAILPVSSITVEVGQFDMQLIRAQEEGLPAPEGRGYQSGPMAGYWNVREYVLYRDGHRCRNCGGRSGDRILQVHHLESRKTGGNSPGNLVTLCRTCHDGYHRGEVELKIRRARPMAAGTGTNIIGQRVYDILRERYGDEKVRLTRGYVTKMRRSEHGLEKTHCIDARCISGNPGAAPVEGTMYRSRKVACHTRSLHVMKTGKKGARRSKVASHKIGRSRFQRYDMVMHEGKECFISGSTGGRPVLKDIDWNRVTEKQSVNVKEIKFVRRMRNGIIIQKVK